MKALTNAVPRLARVSPYRTADLDEARWHISELFVPHRLDIVGRNQLLDVCISRAELEGISLVYHRHGARVRVQPEKLSDIFLLQIPIRGDAHIKVDQQDVYCSEKQAVMLSPDNGIDMTFNQGCEQLIVRVEQPNLERHLEQQLGRHILTPLEFAPAVPLTTPAAREIIELLRFMTLSLTDDEGICSSALARKHMASLLLSGLLTCLDHNYRDELSEESRCPKPIYIQKAQRYMRKNLGEAIGPEDIAAAVEVSTRALFAGFQTYLGTSPMRHLKELRLDMVRENLLRSEQTQASITTVAMDYGFHHLGHFCADYKARFGEQPRETLYKSVN